MVAKTPPKLKKMVAPPLNPILVRETLKKVEMCMGRLQELQFTVTGGNKVISGVSLSPRSTRSYLKTSLRCKQESLRIKNGGARKSPVGKFPASAAEWKRMSLPAMLVGETVGEILRASKFAREIVESVTNNGKNTTFMDDPRTPLAEQRNHRPKLEDTELRARRKKEKQEKRQSYSPLLQRARSRINFKVSPPSKRDVDKENARYLANRVSPKNKPWSKKAVLFPNPLFLSSDNSQHPKFCRTKSPIITKNRQTTPHKFLIKSPVTASKFHVKMASRSPPRQASLSKHSPVSAPKFHVKIRSPPVMVSRSPPRQASLSKQSPVSASKFHVKIRSPPRQASLSKQSPKKSAAFKLRQSFSPARLTASKLRQSFSPARLRQSFSPSRLAARLVSPLKSRKGVQKQKYDGHIIPSGLKHPTTTQLKI